MAFILTKNQIKSLKASLAGLLFFVFTVSSFAEGTKELRPQARDKGYLCFYDSYNNFAQYDASPEERLHITICNPGEVIYYGSQIFNGNTGIRWRLRAPDGTIYNEENHPMSNGNNGYINSYAEAVAGPEQLNGGTNTAGYQAHAVTANMVGDWYLEYNTGTRNRRQLEYFDITVADSPGGNAITGRVWSNAWCMSTEGFGNPYNGTLYMYSDDMIVTALDFNGIKPYVYVITANRTGVVNTGNFEEDRKSINGYVYYAQYKIFLNNPDESCFPTGNFGSLTESPTVTGCGEDKCININSDSEASVQILLDLNGITGYQPNTEDLLISEAINAGPNCIPWDSRDGLGNLIVDGIAIDLEIDYLNGITHLPMTDVELHQFGYTVSLVRPAGPKPQLFWDDSDLGMGSELNGCINPAGCHTWGNPNDRNNFRNSIGNNNTINTWWYANVINETINTTQIIIDVDANINIPGKGDDNDTLICKDTGPIPLFGQESGSVTGVLWSTSGTGTFSDKTDRNSTYTPSQTDLDNNGVTLTIETTGNAGGCPAASDYMRITFSPEPTLTGSATSTTCENNPNITLTSNQTVAGGVIWSGGNGTFIPSVTSNNPTYAPTLDEINNRSVTLLITTTDNGICSPTSKSFTTTIEPAPLVSTGSAGTPQSVCENNTLIQLNGSYSNANLVTWSGGAGTFFPNINDTSATYQPTQTEIDAGAFTLTLTTDAAGSCDPESDDITYTITSKPTVEAGAPIQGCDNNDTIQLNGSFTVSTGAEWTSSGTGSFIPDATDMNAKYILSTADKSSSTVRLFLTTTGNSTCSPEKDSVDISIQTAPTVTITPNATTVCSNSPVITASVTVGGSNGGTWSSGGSGTFSPNTTSSTISYTPSSDEINNANIASLIYVANDIIGCKSVGDTIDIIINPSPWIIAGSDQSICKNNPNITLSGTSIISDATEWIGGTGTFTNPVNNPSNTYIPSNLDLATGFVDLVLKGDFANCASEYDSLRVTFTESPTLTLGPNKSVCENNPEVSLSASSTVATGVTWIGSGTFSDPNGLTTTYTPTSTEITGGPIYIYATTTGNGNCSSVTDSVNIAFTPAPTVDAGPDATTCYNVRAVRLNGSLNGATQGIWSGGSGRYRSSANDLSLNYRVANNERNANNATSITLTLTSVDNGNCLPVSDDVVITVEPLPRITNFANSRICANDTAAFSVNVNNASGIELIGGNGTFLPNRTSKDFTYIPSSQEIIDGSVAITATSTGNGVCNATNLTRTITLDPIPSIEAGNDVIVCDGASSIDLTATTQNVSSVQWSTTGSNTSFGNRNNKNTTFTFTQNDIDRGSVDIAVLGRKLSGSRCNNISDNLTVTFASANTIQAGPNQTVCTNSFPVQLNAIGSQGTWTSTGGGIFNDPSSLVTTYTPSSSEIASGNATLTFNTSASGLCPSVSDQLTITILQGPEAIAGPDQTICANETALLSGAIVQATGGLWTTSGGGSFDDPTNLNARYTPSANDSPDSDTTTLTFYLSTTGTTPCAVDVDTMRLKIAPAPMVDAGPDITVCANDTVKLSGSVENASGSTWSGGSGTFDTPNQINTNYFSSPADTIAGAITLSLTTVASSFCKTISDDITITFAPVPSANVGPDITACADTSFIALNGSVNHANSGLWFTNGTGTFSLSNASLNTSYFPSTTDTSAASVKLWMESTGNGVCAATADTLNIIFTPIPTIEAGNDITTCADATSITLNGSLTVASQGIWSTNGTGSFDNVNSNTPVYTLSNDDRLLNTILFTFTTVDPGLCNNYKDDVRVTLTSPPTVDAGFPLNVCAGDTAVQLNSTVSIAGGVKWSTDGSGLFSNDTVTNPYYKPSANDTASGTIILRVVTTDNGLCNSVLDSVEISFTPEPTLVLGSDILVCADTSGIELTGNYRNVNGIEWSTLGTGNFFSNPYADTVVYAPSPGDTANRTVDIILMSNPSICPSISDTLTINIVPQPKLTISSAFEVCADSTDISINSSVKNATGLEWSTSGSGIFSSNTSTTSTYTPSDIDTLAGLVNLTVTSTGNGLCKSVSESTTISFESLPVISAGADQSICAKNTGITLLASENNTDGIYWSSLGTGVFGPDSTTLNAVYYPSPADTAIGVVDLILSSINNRNCSPTSDTVRITIQPEPTIDAGNDINVCADISTVELNATVKNANGGNWSLNSGTGIFSSASDLKTFYTPSAIDTANKTVVAVIQSSGNGLCPAAVDTIKINIAPELTVNAGPDQTDCEDAPFIRLVGQSNNGSYSQWTTSGNGFFTDSSQLTTTYSLGMSEASIVTFTLTVKDTVNGCKDKSDNLRLDLSPIPIVNAGNDLIVCNGLDSIPLSGLIQNAGGGKWDFVNAPTGQFLPDANNTNIYYKPSATDFSNGSVDLRLISTQNGRCLAYNDNINISFSPTPPISAGNDTTICTTDLPFMLQGALNTGTWITGNGTFTPDRNTSNALYEPTAAELSAGSVTIIRETNDNGSCLTGRDTIVLSFTSGPTIDIGNNIEACSNDNAVSLTGMITVATGINWSTSGSGTFDDSTSATPVYSPSVSDVNAGSVFLEALTTGNGTCGAQTDNLLLTFKDAPTVNAGTDRVLCADNPSLTLNGSFTNASTITWSGGAGSFSDVNDINTTYTANASEISAGIATLYLTTGGHLNCNSAVDTMVITITPIPVVSVLPDTTICESLNEFQLAGSIQNAIGGVWTTSGTGIFSPSDTALNAQYVPSVNDKTSSVFLTLTSEGNGLCNAVSNTFELSFQDISSVTPDLPIITECSNVSSISLNTVFNNATGVIWETTGSGTFGDSLSNSTTYTPSLVDKINPSVILIVKSTGNGVCDTASSSVTINFEPTPTVNAGFDIDICADEPVIQLTGSFTLSTSATWSTNGSGTFSPKTDDMRALYEPSAADTTAGSIDIFLTTSPTLCPAQVDTMRINFSPLPLVNAGDTLQLCDDTTAISLNGIITNAPGGIWNTSGDGFFSTSSSDLTGTYVLGSSDIANQFIGLTLENFGNNLCPRVNDVVIIELTNQPDLSLVSPSTICENSPFVELSATGSNYSSLTWSTPTNGTFTGGNTLTPTYTVGADDISNGYIDLSLTAVGLKTCKDVTDLVQISMQSLPKISAGPDIALCANNGIKLYDGYVEYGNSYWATSGTGIFTPNITDIDVTYVPSAADTASRQISLSINTFDDGICTSTADTLVIDFLPQPRIELTSTPLCELSDGILLQATVNNNNPGNWTSNGSGNFSPSPAVSGTIFYPTLDDFNSGEVTINYTTDNSLGCNTVTSTVIVGMEPMPVANAGSDLYTCRNSEINLTAQLEEGVSYEWFLNSTSISDKIIVKTTASNDIELTVVVTDDKGCQSRDTVDVFVYDLPTFNLPSPFCYNDTLVLDAAPQNIPAVPGIFQWYKNSSLIAGQNTSIVSVDTEGEYIITYSYQNCSADAKSIVFALPEIETTDALSCTGDDVKLSTTEIAGASYDWQLNKVSIGDLSESITETLQDTTRYLVYVTDLNGCTSLDSMDVIGIEKPIFELNDTSACADEVIILSSAPTNNFDYSAYNPVYNWTQDGTITGFTSDEIAVNEDGTYNGIIVIGQCVTADTAKVSFNPLPVSELPEENLEFCEDDTIGIVLDAGSTYQYFWTPTGDTSRTTLADEEGTYAVVLTNQFGCVTSDSVFVAMVCPPVIFVPTAFTPGIEGENQYFKVFSKYIETFDLTIYNRWGEVIFHTNDQNEGWDGMYLGEIMPVGTYPWVIRYTGRGDQTGEKIKDGRVTLLK